MRHHKLIVIVLVLALAAGCGPDETVVEITATPSPPPPTAIPTATPTPAPSPTPAAIPTPAPTLIPVNLRNESIQAICSVYISAAGSGEWGDNWLEETETIEPMRSQIFQVEEGTYDLQAMDCDGNELDVQYDIELSGMPTWTVSMETVSLTLYNDSGTTICYVYISPSADTSWGDDRLGSAETVPSGESRRFTVLPETYDLRAEDCNSNALSTRWEVTVADSTEWVVYPPAPPATAPPPPPVSTSGTIYLESYTTGGATCRISIWGSVNFLLDAGPGSPASREVPPGGYGWQGFFGAGQTNASALTITAGGSCYFACYDTYIQWGCSP
jgi:hypothetical protein